MCVHVCVCVCVCVRVCTCIVYVSTCVCVCMFMCECVCTCSVCVYATSGNVGLVTTHMTLHVHKYVWTFWYVTSQHVCVHVCMCVREVCNIKT